MHKKLFSFTYITMKYYLFVVQQNDDHLQVTNVLFLNTYSIFRNISSVICIHVICDLCNSSYIPEAFILCFPGYRLSAWNLQDDNDYYNNKIELT